MTKPLITDAPQGGVLYSARSRAEAFARACERLELRLSQHGGPMWVESPRAVAPAEYKALVEARAALADALKDVPKR